MVALVFKAVGVGPLETRNILVRWCRPSALVWCGQELINSSKHLGWRKQRHALAGGSAAWSRLEHAAGRTPQATAQHNVSVGSTPGPKTALVAWAKQGQRGNAGGNSQV